MSKELFDKRLAELSTEQDALNFLASGEYMQYYVSQLDAFYAVAKKLEEISGKPINPIALSKWIADREAEKSNSFNKTLNENMAPAIDMAIEEPGH